MVKTQLSKSTQANQPSFEPRPPVVTVLGHIDHGKTTLLDFIRKENVAQKEAGGITQHIGAYQVKIKAEKQEKPITFIDTPGHEVFSQMRSRGAEVADIALLVVSAKDGVMPQTKESIVYIKKAKIPMIVAINKIDIFESKAEKGVAVKKIEKQLKKLGIIVEKEGGEIVSLPVSAKSGENINDLLEMIVLLSEIKGIKVKKGVPLKGVIIDSKVDRRQGVLATVLVQQGYLKVRDLVEAEGVQGRIKALFNEYGQKVEMARPSKPVQVLGFEKAPPIGGIVKSQKSQKSTSLASKRFVSSVAAPSIIKSRLALEGTEEEKLPVILKTDTLGTKETILTALGKRVEIVAASIGDISESDVFFAKTSKAPILGFNVTLLPEIKNLAQREGVKIKIYHVIYKLLEEVEEIIEFLKEEKKEKVLGRAEIIAQFTIKKKKIAGVRILEGRIARGNRIKIMRGEGEIGQAKIISLRHQKEDIVKAEIGEECGISFSKELDFKIEDVVKSIG